MADTTELNWLEEFVTLIWSGKADTSPSHFHGSGINVLDLKGEVVKPEKKTLEATIEQLGVAECEDLNLFSVP